MVKGKNKAPAEIAADTLRGDVRDVLLGHIRALPKPWPQMSEQEKEDAIVRAERLADDLVRKAVDLAASKGFPHFPVQLGKFTVGDSIEGKFSAAFSHENLDGLASRKGLSVVLVPRDVTEFLGEKAAAVPERDQPSIFDDDDFADSEDGDDEDEEQDDAA
ncbi:hypothetical protein [Xanthobacter flavus]|uniref:hypothetical protein n=1 Tax=Xanthobacter flavus TaxID=281 RepID=UPI003726CC01